PDSLPNLHLSPTVRLDYSQVLPTRTATLSHTASDRVHVVINGPVGHRARPSVSPDEAMASIDATRRVIARLEQRHPLITTDLGWVTRAGVLLELGGLDASTWNAAWEATIDIPPGIPFERPGSSTEWRVTVEEFELFTSDRLPPLDVLPEPRVIYADHLAL